MKKNILLIGVTILMSSLTSFGETGNAPALSEQNDSTQSKLETIDKQTADYIYSTIDIAIDAMENHQYELAGSYLDKILADYPDHYVANYERAMLSFYTAKYTEGIERLERMKDSPEIQPRYYVLLGASYDYAGDADKAIEIFKEGVARFPKSGTLYQEIGIMYNAQGMGNEALKYFSQGIEAEPGYPTNYYYSAKLTHGSTRPAWDLFYSEICMNLYEPTYKRVEELGKGMVETITSHLKVEKKELQLDLNLSEKLREATADTLGNIVICTDLLYETIFNVACSDLKYKKLKEGNELEQLANIHLEIINKKTMFMDNPLTRHYKKISESGHAKAYCMWLYSYAYPEQYEAWMLDNKDAVDSFLAWFQDYTIDPGEGMSIYSHSYTRTNFLNMNE
jgi:tetratricopeptide (TPR) repeat protein